MVDYFVKLYSAGFDPMWIFQAVMLGLLMVLFSQRSNTPKRRVRRALLASYCLMVFAFTVFDRESTGVYRYELIPFWSYRAMMFDEIILNYLMFLPIGYWLTALTKKRKAVVIAFFFTVTIEVLQLILQRGLFEFDDIIGNTFGAYLGYRLYFWPARIQFYHKFTRKKRLAHMRGWAQQIKPSIASVSENENCSMSEVGVVNGAVNSVGAMVDVDSGAKSSDEIANESTSEIANESTTTKPAPKFHYSRYGHRDYEEYLGHHGHQEHSSNHSHNVHHSSHSGHRHRSNHGHHERHEHRHHYKEYYRYEDEYNTLPNRIIRHGSHIRRIFSL